MSATAFTIGLRTDLSNAVSQYFTKFRVLPPKNLSVTSTKTPRGVVCFETLLEAIEAESTTSAVIVVHGHEDGSGLFLPLARRGQAAVGARTTHDKLQRLMTIAGRSPPRIDPGDRQTLELRDAEINRLIALMRKLRDKNMQAIEFRGCNLGRNANSVARFRSFFGAASFGAPNLHSFFGLNPTSTANGIMTAHSSTHQGTTFTFTQSLSGRRCHCCIGVNSERKPQNGHVVADDAGTLDRWIQSNFDAAGSRGRQRMLPTHGLWKFPEIDLTNPDIFANTDPRPIFPLEVNSKGQNEYKLHVVYSP